MMSLVALGSQPALRGLAASPGRRPTSSKQRLPCLTMDRRRGRPQVVGASRGARCRALPQESDLHRVDQLPGASERRSARAITKSWLFSMIRMHGGPCAAVAASLSHRQKVTSPRPSWSLQAHDHDFAKSASQRELSVPAQRRVLCSMILIMSWPVYRPR